MTNYHIEFWRGAERIFDYEDDECRSRDHARRHVEGLIQEMMTDAHGDDWTGCRFEVTTSRGKPVLQVPVLPTMSAITRRTQH
jgi:hypothetical protein